MESHQPYELRWVDHPTPTEASSFWNFCPESKDVQLVIDQALSLLKAQTSGASNLNPCDRRWAHVILDFTGHRIGRSCWQILDRDILSADGWKLPFIKNYRCEATMLRFVFEIEFKWFSVCLPSLKSSNSHSLPSQSPETDKGELKVEGVAVHFGYWVFYLVHRNGRRRRESLSKLFPLFSSFYLETGKFTSEW